jgi:hypothetical protein
MDQVRSAVSRVKADLWTPPVDPTPGLSRGEIPQCEIEVGNWVEAKNPNAPGRETGGG